MGALFTFLVSCPHCNKELKGRDTVVKQSKSSISSYLLKERKSAGNLMEEKHPERLGKCLKAKRLGAYKMRVTSERSA